MLKKCRLCKIEKELAAFSRNLHKKDGLNFECKECQKIEFKKYYEKNKNKHVDRVNKRIKGILKVISEIKAIRGCTLCDEKDHNCLQFHHLDATTKIGLVRQMNGPQETIDEIHKCVLLCANCHSKVHRKVFKVTIQHLVKLTQQEKVDIDKVYIRREYKYQQKNNQPPKVRGKISKCPEKEVLQNLLDSKSIKDIALEYQVSTPTIEIWIKKTGVCRPDQWKYSDNKPADRSQAPPKEELEELVWTVPATHIAIKYGVSDSAIVKWCRKYGIKKPPRGYWRQQECMNK